MPSANTSHFCRAKTDTQLVYAIFLISIEQNESKARLTLQRMLSHRMLSATKDDADKQHEAMLHTGLH